MPTQLETGAQELTADQPQPVISSVQALSELLEKEAEILKFHRL